MICPPKYFLFLLLFLVGCDSHTPISFDELRSSLQVNNSVLDGTVIEPDKLTLPFSEAYLKQRHFLYERADITSFDVSQQSELAYLKIQERYPERFLPWPAQTNILRNLTTKNASVEHWSTFVVQRLSDAKESKILLSRYERNTLSGYIEEASDEANELKAYLAQYKPRTRLGLYQHPNGKEWYQSKLNYYYGMSKSPNETLNKIQTELAHRGKKVLLELPITKANHVALSYLQSHCELVQGLNWVDAYTNLPATAKHCAVTHNSDITRLFLSLMEIDIGLHYQGWSKQQARVTLQARLRLTDFEADRLVEGTVLYPATIFSLTPFVMFSS
ncbi:hypothetical protein [Pseudoalteromonas sp. MSK9-3]|uniref:hypothetical protein n=1 Tax=Pseudoalteromonas sp. MSK9-3 TaxID=1897633 RepID=UPI000E6C06A6|nr:hypothetical protein [Pseudoalteromonas sp. MSK9-3]